MTETLDSEVVARHVVEMVHRLFVALGAALLRLDPESGTMEAVAQSGTLSRLGRGLRVSLDANVSGRAIIERKTIATSNVFADPRFVLTPETKARIEALGHGSVLAVPLVSQDEVLGALAIVDLAGRVFGDEEVRLAEAFARQAAVALANSELFARAQEARAEAEGRRREAEMLADLARTLSASLDLPVVLQRVAEGARELCQSDVARVALRDPESGALAFRYWTGPTRDWYATYRMEPGKGLGGLVLATGRPFRTDDYAADERISKDYLSVALGEGAVAVLGVPIGPPGDAQGAILLVNHTRRPFTDRDEAVVVRLAEHASVAIRNAQLFASEQAAQRASQAYAERLQVLNTIQREILAAGSSQEIARMALGHLREWTGAPRAVVALYDLGAGEGEWLAVETDRETSLPAGARFPLEMMGDLAELRQGRVQLISVARLGPLPHVRTLEREGVRSYAVVPLSAGEELIGSLNFGSGDPGGPPREAIELAREVAPSLAVALQQARLREARQRASEALRLAHGDLARRVDELTALWESGVAAGVQLDASSVAQHAIRTLERLLRYERGSIWVVASGDELELLAHSDMGLHGEALEGELRRVRGLVRLGQGITGWVAQHGQTVRTGDVTRDPRYVEADPTIRSELCVPLRVSGRTIGAFNVESGEPDAFSEHDERLLVTLAAQTAVAIENARLYGELARQAAELERRVAERTAALREANAEMEAFTSSVSHDLRAPLRAIQGFAQALLEDYGARLDDTGRDYARRVVAAGERLDGLVQDLLAYSRLSRAELPLRPVDLGAVARDVLAQLEAELRERDARVTVVEPLPAVLGHGATLGQVLLNLVTNGVKFVAAGVAPQMRIHAETRAGGVRLWVEDNGIGIAPRHHERIFGIFERLHGAERYPGTGIGLAVVRRAVERMGGSVGVESAVGQGSRFWIELPAAEARP